jgi:hypothetical protein
VAERQRLGAKQTREAKAKLKTRTEHLADAQAVFNQYIRARDAALPCISCGRHHTGAWDAGHYRSVGAQPVLRFHGDNTHKQCVPCNQHKGGNAIEYRIGLRTRIGDERLEFLEREHSLAKYTIEDAKRINAEYAIKFKIAESFKIKKFRILSFESFRQFQKGPGISIVQLLLAREVRQ